MDTLKFRKEVLINELKLRESYTDHLLILLDSYGTLKKANYLASGFKQTERAVRLGQKFSEYVRKLEDNDVVVTRIEQELKSIEAELSFIE